MANQAMLTAEERALRTFIRATFNHTDSVDVERLLDAAVIAILEEERRRILAIISGGDRPWQDIAQAIREGE